MVTFTNYLLEVDVSASKIKRERELFTEKHKGREKMRGIHKKKNHMHRYSRTTRSIVSSLYQGFIIFDLP